MSFFHIQNARASWPTSDSHFSLSALDVAFLLFVFSIPFDGIATTVFGLAMSFSRNLGILFFVLCLAKHGAALFNFDKIIWLLFPAIGIAIFHLLQDVNELSGIVNTITISLLFNTFIFIATIAYLNGNLEKGILAIKYQGLLIGLTCIWITLFGFAGDFGREHQNRLSVAELDENWLASQAALGCIGASFLALDLRVGYVIRTLSVVVIPFSLKVMIDTGSRGGIIALACCIVAMYFLLKDRWRWSSVKYPAILLLTGLVIVMAQANTAIVDRLEKTIDGSGTERLSGRDEIWKSASTMILESPIVGWGELQFQRELGLRTKSIGMRNSHNTLFFMLLLCGIPAGLLFFGCFTYPILSQPTEFWTKVYPEIAIYFLFYLLIFLNLDQIQSRTFWVVVASAYSLRTRMGP